MSELDSREKILKAAITVFAEKGKYGARMEEIAAKADVNKAMLYYYYSTKENLHQQTLGYVISKNLSQLFGRVDELLLRNTDPVVTLKQIIAAYFEVFSSEKTFVKLMLEALASKPQELANVLSQIKSDLNLFEHWQGYYRECDNNHQIAGQENRE